MPGVAGFTLPTDPGRYQLMLDATRTAQPRPLSGHVQAVWTFGSARTDPATRTTLDMLDIGIHLPLDQFNAAGAGRPLAGTVDVTHQQGSAQLSVRSVGVQVSYDDGKTWQAATVRGGSPAWSLVIPAGGGKAAVSRPCALRQPTPRATP